MRADTTDAPGQPDDLRRPTLQLADNHPTGKNDRTVPATCQTHRGCRGFCNLRMTKVNGEIVLDPHVAGCCVISFDENQATTVRDTLTE